MMFEHLSFSLIPYSPLPIILFLGLNVKGTEGNHTRSYSSYMAIERRAWDADYEGMKWDEMDWTLVVGQGKAKTMKTVTIREGDEELAKPWTRETKKTVTRNVMFRHRNVMFVSHCTLLLRHRDSFVTLGTQPSVQPWKRFCTPYYNWEGGRGW
jgi:hypothetical protein